MILRPRLNRPFWPVARSVSCTFINQRWLATFAAAHASLSDAPASSSSATQTFLRPCQCLLLLLCLAYKTVFRLFFFLLPSAARRQSFQCRPPRSTPYSSLCIYPSLPLFFYTPASVYCCFCFWFLHKLLCNKIFCANITRAATECRPWSELTGRAHVSRYICIYRHLYIDTSIYTDVSRYICMFYLLL